LWPHGADVANTVPNLFPTRARMEGRTELVMRDGLTRSGRCRITPVNPSQVIRGRCRNVLPSDRQATPLRRGPQSCQPEGFRWPRLSASVLRRKDSGHRGPLISRAKRPRNQGRFTNGVRPCPIWRSPVIWTHRRSRPTTGASPAGPPTAAGRSPGPGSPTRWPSGNLKSFRDPQAHRRAR
jgi:hypothetical protein